MSFLFFFSKKYKNIKTLNSQLIWNKFLLYEALITADENTEDLLATWALCQQKFTHCYRPQTKLRKGNVFTSVCQEFCPQKGEEVYTLRADSPPHPPGQTPSLDRHPPPQGRRLLQRTVRILLECILVTFKSTEWFTFSISIAWRKFRLIHANKIFIYMYLSYLESWCSRLSWINALPLIM